MTRPMGHDHFLPGANPFPGRSAIISPVAGFGVVVLFFSWLLPLQSLVASDLHFDFQEDEVGRCPQGFSFHQGRTEREVSSDWRVIRDGENHVLVHRGAAGGKHRSALAIVEKCESRDIKLSVKLKFSRDDDEATGGVFWRYQNAGNYLVARLDYPKRRVRLYRVVNGNVATFGHADPVTLDPETWYELRVEHKRETVKVYLDDEVVIMVKDRHFHEAGRAGLWTKWSSQAYFDDLRIRQWSRDE